MLIMVSMIIILLVFLLGYAAGRRKGLKEGRDLDILYCPFLIRMQSLKRGMCKDCKSLQDCVKLTSVIE